MRMAMRMQNRVCADLALVVGLRGHVAEAESIMKADRPAGEAARI